ncbi:MAG: hypothetical protein WBI07_20755 [Mobilitalea sp.]
MPIPVLTALIIIFVIWLQYESRRTGNLSTHTKDSFWEKEKDSNVIKRSDISSLDYITIPFDRLPLADHVDTTINSYRDTVLKLADKKILILTGLSNTELKYKYGTPNLTILSEYDNNYTVLVSFLQKWAERLYEQGFEAEALPILEFAVSCGSDVSSSYVLLASIYKHQSALQKIDHLLDTVQNSNIMTKDNLIEELNTIKTS